MFEEFLSLLSIGLGLGAVYAIGAVGLALIYRFTGILHFAHGATFVVASYVLLGVATQSWALLVLGVVASVAAAAATGGSIYTLVYTPLERRRVTDLGFVISSFGLLIVAENALTLGFGSTARTVALPSWLTGKTFHMGAVDVRVADLTSIVMALVVIGLLGYGLRRSRTGLLIRALERNKQLGADLGISYRHYATVVFVVGSGLAGISAVMSALTVPVSPDGGLDWTVSVYIAMAVGGTGSIWSAAVGGLVLGVLSTVPDMWVPGSWNTALAFGVLVLVLMISPNGLVPRADRSPSRQSPLGSAARAIVRRKDKRLVDAQ